MLTHPEQAPTLLGDLVDHGQVLVAAAPLHLVDTNGAEGQFALEGAAGHGRGGGEQRHVLDGHFAGR